MYAKEKYVLKWQLMKILNPALVDQFGTSQKCSQFLFYLRGFGRCPWLRNWNPKFSFVTPDGLYKLNVLPFVLKNSHLLLKIGSWFINRLGSLNTDDTQVCSQIISNEHLELLGLLLTLVTKLVLGWSLLHGNVAIHRCVICNAKWEKKYKQLSNKIKRDLENLQAK